MKKKSIGIVGATGLVGREMIKILEEREFPISKLRLFASPKSTGRTLSYQGKDIVVKAVSDSSFADLDFVLFSAGTKVSLQYAPVAIQAGCTVIDNSKAFRMEKTVPLIVPEINSQLLKEKPKLIANPNCSTIQMVVALKPVYDAFGISKIVVSTYQAVSGTGKNAVTELQSQTKSVLAGIPVEKSVYPHQIAFNCLPQIDDFLESGYTLEEMKLVNETRKIFNDEALEINPTAVRVPVFNGHCESIYVECKKEVSVNEIFAILKQTAGVKLFDKQNYPMAIQTETEDKVLVGRIRRAIDNRNAFSMWVVANNLRKGAALNAVQILEACIAR